MTAFPSLKLQILKTPLGISICAHLIVLLILALIVIEPESKQIWHDFEWLSQLTDELPTPLQETENPDESSENSTTASSATTVENSASIETSPAPSNVIPKRQIIDAPGELADPSPSTSPKTISNLGSRGNVNRSGLIQGTGPGGSSSKLEGTGIRSKKEVLPSLRISDYGEVRLSFQVSPSGLVLGNSIIVVKSATSAQNQSAIEALKQWEFIVAPGNAADQSYSILFIFNPGK